MNRRYVQGWSTSRGIAWPSLHAQAGKSLPRGRRTLSAFLTGCFLLALGFCCAPAGVAAGVVNRFSDPISLIMSRIGLIRDEPASSEPTKPNLLPISLGPSPRHLRKGLFTPARPRDPAASLPRRSVCVRLCDGYFFPIDALPRARDAGEEAAECSGLCPDAPTQLFVEPAGSDRIEDAVAGDGARYTALPVAFRNRTSFDKTCACHRRPGESFRLLDDITLRKGDSIMTPSGFEVFRGAGRSPHTQGDFISLARAAMPADKRAVLAAIERATLPGLRQSAEAPSPRKPEIAFVAPSPNRATSAPLANSIRFVEPMMSANN